MLLYEGLIFVTGQRQLFQVMLSIGDSLKIAIWRRILGPTWTVCKLFECRQNSFTIRFRKSDIETKEVEHRLLKLSIILRREKIVKSNK